MAEDIIRYDDMRSHSIAEMNLKEQIADILNTIEKEMSRTGEMFSSLLEGKCELVKKAYELVRALKEEAQKKKEGTMEYLVRVTPNLLNKEMYMFALIHLDTLSQQIDELAYKLAMAASFNTGLPEPLGAQFGELFASLSEMIRLLRDEAKQLIVSGGSERVLEYHDKILVLEEKVDEKQRKLLGELLRIAPPLPTLFILKETLDTLESSSDRIREASHVFRYLALFR